jgi:lipopolysaccharide transport system ATP-binding protein
MEFDVFKRGRFLVPNLHFVNEEGVYLFVASNHDPKWQRRPRPTGRFISAAWIPGNFVSEGTLMVGSAGSAMDPVVVHFFERDAVAFHGGTVCSGTPHEASTQVLFRVWCDHYLK